MDAIETITYKGEKIEICRDDNAQSPNEWGDEGKFIVYNHRQFCVERKGFDPRLIFYQNNEQKRMFYDGYFVFTLYAYIHSDVSLSLGRGSDRWDTSSSGFVLIKQQKGTYHRTKAFEIAKELIDTWNMYLNGEVYGYNCPFGSCWGFYGDEGKKEMIEEAKHEIDCVMIARKKAYFQRKKVEIKHHVPFEKRLSFEWV